MSGGQKERREVGKGRGMEARQRESSQEAVPTNQPHLSDQLPLCGHSHYNRPSRKLRNSLAFSSIHLYYASTLDLLS